MGLIHNTRVPRIKTWRKLEIENAALWKINGRLRTIGALGSRCKQCIMVYKHYETVYIERN